MSELTEKQGAAVRLPTGKELLLSTSPHIHSGRGIRAIMIKVMIALLPAAAAGVWWFGWDALRVLVLSMVFAVAAEALWCWWAKKPLGTVGDCSAALSGLLLGMNLPSGASWWLCILGALIAIWLGKQIYGGLGHNLFNPVLVARVALLIALPAAMTTWPAPREVSWAPESFHRVDATTTATPLGETKELAKTGQADGFGSWNRLSVYIQYALGNKGGCIGETSSVALILGGVLLLCWGIIKWQIPVLYILTVMVITGLTNWGAPDLTPQAMFHLLTGGLLLGAIFMATDTVTSPVTAGGQLCFGIGCGIITAVIRIWGNYPEGVSFSILLMNAATPLFDRLCVLRPFGYVRRRKRSGQ